MHFPLAWIDQQSNTQQQARTHTGSLAQPADGSRVLRVSPAPGAGVAA